MSAGYTNIARTTLNGSINNAVTTIVLTDGSIFPSAGDFWLNIENEIIKVPDGGLSGNTITGATRGVAGGGATAAASHISGATVELVISSQFLDQMRQDIHRYGSYSGLASVTGMKTGDVYHFQSRDTPYEFAIYNGSSWDKYYQGKKCTPPVLADYTWVNQGSATASEASGTIIITSSSTSGIALLSKTAPSTPYTITGLFLLSIYGLGGVELGFRDNTTGELSFINTGSGAEDGYLYVSNYNSPTSFAANLYSDDPSHTKLGVIGLRISDDGTDRKYYASNDLVSWDQVATTPRLTFLTPDRIFFGINTTLTIPQHITVLSIEQG